MVREPRRWANAEKQCIAWLKAATGRPVYNSTPDNLGTVVPAYKVTRVGGAGRGEIEKDIDLEVEAFVASRGALWDAVAVIETAMDALKANGTAAWYVDDVEELFGFGLDEGYENPDIVKATATYRVTLRPLSN